VQVQIYATWVFYAVLIDLCQEVADLLGEPVERISVEMVFRGLSPLQCGLPAGRVS
jgi:hypothetical protein